MGYQLIRLEEPVSKAVPKPLVTEFGIHCRLESCVRCMHFLSIIPMYSIVIRVRYSSVPLYFKGNKMFSVTPSPLCHFRHRAMVVVNTPFGMGAALDFAKKEIHQHSNLKA